MTAAPLFRSVEEPIRLEVKWSGAARTKKNHGRIVMLGKAGQKRPVMLPSKPYAEWESASVPVIKAAMSSANRETIMVPVNCCAKVFRNANRGDLIGYLQAIADLLEAAGVLKNDSQIVSWDGSRMLIDREKPRVEVLLEEVR